MNHAAVDSLIYRATLRTQILPLGYAIVALLVGCAGILKSSPNQSPALAWVTFVYFSLCGLLLASVALTQLRFRLEIDGETIRLTTALSNRTVRMDDVVGRRSRGGGRGGPDYDILLLRAGAGRALRIPNYFVPDQRYDRWIKSFPDTTLAAFHASYAQLRATESLGVSQVARDLAILRARRLGWSLASLAVAIGILALTMPESRRLWLALMALMPWVAVGICAVRPMLYCLVPASGDARVGLAGVFLLPALYLVIGMSRRMPVMPGALAILIGAALFSATLLADPSLRRQPGRAMLALFACAINVYSLAVWGLA